MRVVQRQGSLGGGESTLNGARELDELREYRELNLPSCTGAGRQGNISQTGTHIEDRETTHNQSAPDRSPQPIHWNRNVLLECI